MPEPMTIDTPLSPEQVDALRPTIAARSNIWPHQLLVTIDHLRAALATARAEQREADASIAQEAALGERALKESAKAAGDHQGTVLHGMMASTATEIAAAIRSS